jgi:hypothetical protein
MKILSDEFQEKIDEVEGQKPKIVIVIEWDNGIGYYSDRILLFDLVSTEARIMNMAELAVKSKLVILERLKVSILFYQILMVKSKRKWMPILLKALL